MHTHVHTVIYLIQLICSKVKVLIIIQYKYVMCTKSKYLHNSLRHKVYDLFQSILHRIQFLLMQLAVLISVQVHSQIIVVG